ncbi:PTS sugar transporter subunit IIA [Coprothermobacter proteolyticus]|uniref:Pts system mannose-specific eiiab component (Eiiab-man) n=1 Tax=Coprothermobacter proteolyticus (strain ATCC 35245 / DSM 5265 / OCM 4 / BT) TaxID=309798 RepID=B5Y676_COPPD|nr:PTS sugar transporter subunit IIA [Coprothermobacter proteolyticus]ACI16935.1 PTS mannose transporter subunit IIAB [Coprothermobacter proteolyticus DSM 5265]MBK6586087.1 PTS sugar transporter subunit IIA [Coprothermobacter sp.]NLT83205.1 PTS sugar transporter subunit IIA [Coprothermobacter proteolyticus]HAR40894.1 PTS mannose transporter subunit IIAB [Coprothermobacter sp.]
MVGMLIVTHGRLGEGLLDAMQMIAGPQEKVDFVSLKEGDSIDELKERILSAVKMLDDGSGVLVFVDMFGASPSNAAAYLLNENVEVITGVNLPMLLEIVSFRESSSLQELSANAMTAGVESIKNLTQLLRASLENS